MENRYRQILRNPIVETFKFEPGLTNDDSDGAKNDLVICNHLTSQKFKKRAIMEKDSRYSELKKSFDRVLTIIQFEYFFCQKKTEWIENDDGKGMTRIYYKYNQKDN